MWEENLFTVQLNKNYYHIHNGSLRGNFLKYEICGMYKEVKRHTKLLHTYIYINVLKLLYIFMYIYILYIIYKDMDNNKGATS